MSLTSAPSPVEKFKVEIKYVVHCVLALLQSASFPTETSLSDADQAIFRPDATWTSSIRLLGSNEARINRDGYFRSYFDEMGQRHSLIPFVRKLERRTCSRTTVTAIYSAYHTHSTRTMMLTVWVKKEIAIPIH